VDQIQKVFTDHSADSMFMSYLLSVLLAVPVALAGGVIPVPKLSGCTVQNNSLVLPAAAVSVLGTPPPIPLFVGVALGQENYTCNTTSLTWTNIGLVSALIDVSCLVDSPMFATFQNETWTEWNSSAKSLTVPKVLENLRSQPADAKFPTLLGTHDFVVNPINGVGFNTRFDFSEYTGQKNDYFIGQGLGVYKDGNPSDVPWFHVASIAGTLAKTVYRTDTKGGNPPASCKAGDQPMGVRYSATYCESI
jgi:hypothetical protein